MFPTARADPESFSPIDAVLKVSIVSPESDGGPSTPGAEMKKETEFPEACTDGEGAEINVKADKVKKRVTAIRRRRWGVKFMVVSKGFLWGGGAQLMVTFTDSKEPY